MSSTDREQRLAWIRNAIRGHEAEWLSFGVRNRVGPIVAHALLEALPTHPTQAEWAALHDASATRMQILLGQLDAVAARLATEGIRLVALKNAGIARGIFPCAACCPMGDLDVLVDRSRFVEAHELLCDSGFVLASRATVEPADLAHGLISGGTEYRKQVDTEEVWLELQWRPVAGRWIRPEQEPSGTDFVARSVPIAGSAARLLSPEDNMLQVALHTAKHSYVRAPGLRLHTDVDRLATFATPDWARLEGAIGALHVRTATFFSFALARALLESPIPEAWLDRLRPPEWKAQAIGHWLRHLNVFEPDERKFSRPQMLVFHALLYDHLKGLASSAFDMASGRGPLAFRPARAVRRIADLLFRYQA
jgi:hypothetical protein